MTSILYHCFRYVDKLRNFASRYLTPLGFGVLICLCISALIGIDTTQSLSYLIFTFSSALMLLAALTHRWIRVRFRASRDIPRYGTVAEPLRYRVKINNLTSSSQKGLKLWDDVANTFPSEQAFQYVIQRYKTGRERRRRWCEQVERTHLAIAHPIDLPDLPPQSETDVTGEVLPLRRGRLRLKSITLACPDPLGLIYRRFTQVLPQSVIILPRRYQLPDLELPTQRRFQAGERILSSSVGDSTEFRSLRDYRPGDTLRKIHWKSSAKLGKPVVREEQEEFGVRHGLILDTFQEEPYSEFFEEAIAVTSSLIHHLHPQHTQLDLMLYGEEGQCFSMGRGIAQADYALQVLAGIQPCQTESFDAIMPFLKRRLARFSSVICIFLTWDQARYTLLKQMIHANIPSKALIFSDGSFRPDATLIHDLAADCRIHFLRRGRVQEDLMRL